MAGRRGRSPRPSTRFSEAPAPSIPHRDVAGSANYSKKLVPDRPHCSRAARRAPPRTESIAGEPLDSHGVLLDHVTSPLGDGREIVLYPPGASWGFRLPAQHTVSVSLDQNLVYLATPDHGSGYVLTRFEESDDELRIHLGAATNDAHAIGTGRVPALRAYSFPRIQDELARLKTELVSVGGSEQEANAWAQGASYDSHTARLRERIRELRRG